MTLHVTYCSKNKKEAEGKIPAIQRYNSNRIRRVKQTADAEGEEFAILSGKYGLIDAETPIPEYDKLLKKEDIPVLLPKLENYLSERKIQKVVYHTKKVQGKRKPYFQAIKEACISQNIEFEKRLLS